MTGGTGVWKWSGKTLVLADRRGRADAPRSRGSRGRAGSPRWRGGGLTWVMDGRATAADAPGSGADQREYLGEERRQRHLQIIWAGADVGGLFAANVRSFANNLGPGPPSFATNLGRKLRCLWVGPRMFVGCYTYLPYLLPPWLVLSVNQVLKVLRRADCVRPGRNT